MPRAHAACVAAVLLAAARVSGSGGGAGSGATPPEVHAAMRWYAERGGSLSPALEVRPSAACGGGLGVFATAPLEPRQVVGSFPLGATVSAACALHDAELGPAARAYLREHAPDGESIVLAAFLAHVRARTRDRPDAASAHAYAAYVNSLPWGDGHGDVPDSLAAHPLIAPLAAGSAGGARDVQLAQHVADARESAAQVGELLAGIAAPRPDAAACLRAVALVASRTFDFSTPLRAAGISLDGDGGLVHGRCVAVPVFDCLNHPSAAALAAHGDAGRRFQEHTILDACLRWRMVPAAGATATAAGGAAAPGAPASIAVLAPSALKVRAGDELWMWYGNAGWGEQNREAWEAKEVKFLAQYGFVPWE
ncbi:hypothetical protein KFE25_011550 [Diacronema lutheri]|uniref:SET domain-containing protein n=1 Tax=Diacronema lutheri TaxID=2081491 RepID=A0A8J5XMZ1_DIALT|nr:hypothetical protein KFE25_011550 [Diacronema lutheri]